VVGVGRMSWRSKPSRVPGPDIPSFANALVDTGANQGCAWQHTREVSCACIFTPTELDPPQSTAFLMPLKVSHFGQSVLPAGKP